MGCGAAIGSLLIAPVAGRLSDWRNRRTKPIYLSLYATCCVATAAFCVSTGGYFHLPRARWVVYATAVTIVTVMNLATPVLFELAADITAPAPESTACGVMVLVNNLVGTAFLLCGVGVNPVVMNWVMLGTTATSLCVLVFLKSSYH
eukprot:TRINITY_DN3299_c0_g1_i1.p3 TRINITY_DN3299_c0_g1~~TRINITY_DN3299_c0_g1_i1.p3  ORF type:complete len:147 (+),score=30.15 TRINITY_DN3299_c0_g1_i1:972-1412(+)